ncbi:MAG TPA: carboxypeptidase-like regulatory domain-containing protein, partial [Catalimonadaceae bacterium]|nr:carboxypeptidase-like regulatory domain-containing protein [Catalimonadaceae bacterium]
MKKIFSLFTFFLFLQSASSLFAQGTQTVRGRILDEASKSPVIGASVVLVRTESPMIGASADVDGNFKITNVPLGRQTFQVKAIGYESRVLANVIVTAGKEVILDINLTEAIQVLNEAV